jgi:hypothetical protein
MSQAKATASSKLGQEQTQGGEPVSSPQEISFQLNPKKLTPNMITSTTWKKDGGPLRRVIKLPAAFKAQFFDYKGVCKDLKYDY